MKRLRSKFIFLTLILVFTFGSLAGALVYHINDAAKAAENEYTEKINLYFKEKDDKIKHDVQHLTNTEIERLKNETGQYLQEKLNTDYQDSLNEKSAEIKKVTNDKIEEIKKFIDQKILEGNSKDS